MAEQNCNHNCSGCNKDCSDRDMHEKLREGSKVKKVI